MRAMELGGVHDADLLFGVTDEEMALCAALEPDTPSFLLPDHERARRATPSFADRRDILFFGGFLAGTGSPNEDALLFAVHEILPPVWDAHPDLVLHVVGADPTPAVLALHDRRINVVGFVDDPTVWLDATRLHLAPLRFGAGIKRKLVETMASGLPIVTTTVGAEGLRLDAVAQHVVADDAAALARLCLDLYSRDDVWERVQAEELSLVERWFSPEVFRANLVDALLSLGLAPEGPLVTPANLRAS